jgi:serine protease Do
MRGQVIGINTAIVAAGQGIGFAIPINMAKEILPELKATGQVTRGWLGVGIQEVSPEIARAVGLKEVKGAMVNMVYPGDPADKAGVKKGDIILAVNAQPIKNPFDLTHMIATLKPGSKIAITVWRDKRELTLSTKLEKRSDEHVAELGGQQEEEETKETKEAKDSLGMTLKGSTPEMAGRLKLEDAKGVLVTGVDPKGPAGDSDIKKGDVIKELNRKEVGGVSDYLKALKSLKKGDTVLLRVVRDGRPFYMAIDIP